MIIIIITYFSALLYISPLGYSTARPVKTGNLKRLFIQPMKPKTNFTLPLTSGMVRRVCRAVKLCANYFLLITPERPHKKI
jgi:hypothetical protein